MVTDLNTLGPASTDSSRSRAERIPAVALVAVYCALLLLIPSKLIVRQIGAAGTPATLWGLMLLLWWLCALAGGQLSTRGRSPVRIGIGLLGVAVLLSYCAAMTRGWYAPSDVRQATDDVYDLVPASVQQVRSAMILAADRGLLAFGAWVGVCLVTVDGLRDWADVHRLLAWICGIATIVAGIATLQFFTGMNIAGFFSIPGLTASYEFGAVDQRSVVRRVYATANHPIEFGVLMATIFPLALHSAIFHAKERRWWIPAALVGFGVTISVSRSAILVLVVGMVTLIVSWPQRWRRNLFLSLPFAIVFVRAMAPGVVGTIRSLFTNLGNDPSVSGRTDDYEVAFRLIGDSPVFGRGLFTFVPRYYRILDNQLLTIALEIGYLGLAAFLGLSLVAITSARGARRRSPDSEDRHLGLVVSASLSGIVVSYATFDAWGFPMAAGLTFVLIGIAGAMWRIAVREQIAGSFESGSVDEFEAAGPSSTRRRENCVMLANIVRAFINSVGASSLVPRQVRWLLLRAYGVDTHAWNIRERCFFGGRDIVIGRGSFVNQGCVFDNLGPIRIGQNCAIGMEIMFAASTHQLGTSSRRAGEPIGDGIVVGDGCWIGSRSVLLPGARIGRGTIVAAGSVVSGELDADALYAGVPARKMRALDDTESARTHQAADAPP